MSEAQGQPTPPNESKEDLSKALTQPLPKDLLLVVFIHGYVCDLAPCINLSKVRSFLCFKIQRDRFDIRQFPCETPACAVRDHRQCGGGMYCLSFI